MTTRFRVFAILCALALMPMTQAAAAGYFGISVGQSDDDVFEETETGFKLSLGGKLNEQVAAEVAYVDLGTIDFGSVEISQSGLAASISPILKINEQAALFAKLGLFAWTFEVSGALSGEETGSDMFFGFGFEYKFSPKAALVAEYESFEVDDGDVSLTSVGVRIGF